MKPNLGNAGKLVRTTHGTYGWLGPVYDAMDFAFRVMTPSGASGIPNSVWFAKDVQRAQVGNASGVVGLYGFTGLPQLATGTAGITGLTGIGASGFGSVWFNGGSGAFYTLSDLFTAAKNAGLLKP